MQFTEWGPVEIEQWLAQCQFSHSIVATFTRHNVTGQTLPFLKDEHLKEMDLSLEDRIKLKIEINRVLVDNGYATNDSYNVQNILMEVQKAVQANIDSLARELQDELLRFKDEVTKSKSLPTPDKVPASPFNLSPTKLKQPHTQTSQSSPVEGTMGRDIRRSVQSPTQSTHVPTAKPVSEPLKQLRASTDDPCSKLLQAAMKRHKLNDDWRNYALVICYGDKERLLKLDEKPVQIFKELKEKGEHPAIMLRQVDYMGESKLTGTPGGML
jgi:hypothetical protein